MTRFDAIRLKQLVENHHRYTGSTLAKDILARWEQYLPKFVKVMPVDYRRALKEIQAQRESEAGEAAKGSH
jgi:glutamate synthase (NADPH/NADH) large chain